MAALAAGIGLNVRGAEVEVGEMEALVGIDTSTEIGAEVGVVGRRVADGVSAGVASTESSEQAVPIKPSSMQRDSAASETGDLNDEDFKLDSQERRE